MLPTILTVNPMARRRKAHAKRQHNRFRYHSRRRAHNPHRSRRHRRHNPFQLSRGNITHQVTGALVGATGAVLTDVAMAYASPYLPATLQTGWFNVLARAAAAIGVGLVAGKVVGRETGKAVAAGGLIVVAYSGLKQALAPTLGTSIKGLSGLADFGDYRPAMPAYSGQSTAMVGGGMGAYMTPRMGRFGAYMNPASILSQAGAGAATSPIRARQMGAYMRSLGGFGGFNGYDSESM